MEPTAPMPHMALLYHPSDKALADAYGSMLKRLIPKITIEFTSEPGTFDRKFTFILVTDNYLDDEKFLKITYDLFSRLQYNIIPVLTTKFEHRKLPICIRAVHPDKLYSLIIGSNPIREINAILPDQNRAVYYYTRSLVNLLKLDTTTP